MITWHNNVFLWRVLTYNINLLKNKYVKKSIYILKNFCVYLISKSQFIGMEWTLFCDPTKVACPVFIVPNIVFYSICVTVK